MLIYVYIFYNFKEVTIRYFMTIDYIYVLSCILKCSFSLEYKHIKLIIHKPLFTAYVTYHIHI